MTAAAILIPVAAGTLFLLVWGAVAWRIYGAYEATGPLVSGFLCLIVFVLVAQQLL